MKLSFLKRSLLRTATISILLTTLGQAAPVEQIPVVVDGKLAPYSRVQKNGRLWYPASVVGHYRSIQFSYDYGAGKLYANGVETMIDSLVVEDVVYLAMSPFINQAEMRPGMAYLESRRSEIEEFEKASPHLAGNYEALMMARRTPNHDHPWSSASPEDQSPIINLDATREVDNAPLMRPGARPPEAAPAPLPNRLPRPGESAGLEESGTIQIPPSAGGMPVMVTAQGGPASPPAVASQSDANGLQPIPQEAAPVASPASPFDRPGNLATASNQNAVFKVAIRGGEWQVTGSESVLHLKLSQVNLSPVAQSNLGSFAVRCDDGSRVEASRTRSYLPDGTLGPGASREGELVFRLSKDKKPRALELEGALPLSVSLSR